MFPGCSGDDGNGVFQDAVQLFLCLNGDFQYAGVSEVCTFCRLSCVRHFRSDRAGFDAWSPFNAELESVRGLTPIDGNDTDRPRRLRGHRERLYSASTCFRSEGFEFSDGRSNPEIVTNSGRELRVGGNLRGRIAQDVLGDIRECHGDSIVFLMTLRRCCKAGSSDTKSCTPN